MSYQTLQARIPVKVFVDDLQAVESTALDQLRNTANLPWVLGIAAMPDVHYGKGATVGSVIVQQKALSPAVVGVDIGCGMIALKTPFMAHDLKETAKLRHSIERAVPVGFNHNKEETETASKALAILGRPSARAPDSMYSKARLQLGSLGGGNHFIEVCLDTNGSVWILLHSGSRNIGKELAERHIRTAKGLMGDLIKQFGSGPLDEDLAALVSGTAPYNEYLEDLKWCQSFAAHNRREMLRRVFRQVHYHFTKEFPTDANLVSSFKVECHHNYVNEEDVPGFGPSLVTRKGAVSAKLGEYGIIPGSMGARSFIVRGKGNPDSFCSCSHGAGRQMSRGAAKRFFTKEDLEKQTEGVECRKDVGVLDEIPGAYKDIEKVMALQSDLVEVVAELKQVLCVKG